MQCSPTFPVPIGSRRAPPAFSCSWTDNGLGVAWVHVAGELDLATTPLLTRTLHGCEADAHVIVLDLRRLTFIDCSGVEAIVGYGIRARGAGHRLIVVRGPAIVDRVFALAGRAQDVETFTLAGNEPPVQVLPSLARDSLVMH